MRSEYFHDSYGRYYLHLMAQPNYTVCGFYAEWWFKRDVQPVNAVNYGPCGICKRLAKSRASK